MCQPVDGDVRASPADPYVGFGCSSSWGSSGAGEGAVCSPKLRAHPRRLPGRGPSPGGGGGVAGGWVRKHAAPNVLRNPAAYWGLGDVHGRNGGSGLVAGAAPDPAGWGRGEHTRGIKSCTKIWAKAGGWWKHQAEPEGHRSCGGGSWTVRLGGQPWGGGRCSGWGITPHPS